MRLQNRISHAKIERYTLGRGVLRDVQGRGSKRAVAEYQGTTSPRMRVRHFNIAGVAWSNFKPGINTNGRIGIFNVSLSIDVANVGAGVGEALVALRGGVRRLSAEVGAAGCGAVLTTCLPGAA